MGENRMDKTKWHSGLSDAWVATGTSQEHRERSDRIRTATAALFDALQLTLPEQCYGKIHFTFNFEDGTLAGLWYEPDKDLKSRAGK